MTCEALGHSLLIPNNYSRLFPFSAESKQLQSWFCPLSSFVFAFHTREAEGTEVVVLVHIRTRLCLLFEDVISLDAHAAAVHHWNLIILTLKWLKCPRAVIYNPVILFLMCIYDDHSYSFLYLRCMLLAVMSVSLVLCKQTLPTKLLLFP